MAANNEYITLPVLRGVHKDIGKKIDAIAGLLGVTPAELRRQWLEERLDGLNAGSGNAQEFAAELSKWIGRQVNMVSDSEIPS